MSRKLFSEAIVTECVQCGFCCTIGVCSFGRWDESKGQCVFLTEESRCEKYEEIRNAPGADFSPAFGSGCSSSLFNNRREKRLREMRDGRSGAPVPWRPLIKNKMKSIK